MPSQGNGSGTESTAQSRTEPTTSSYPRPSDRILGPEDDSPPSSRVGGDPAPLWNVLGSLVDAWGQGMTAWLRIAAPTDAAAEGARQQNGASAAGRQDAGDEALRQLAALSPALLQATITTAGGSLRCGAAVTAVLLRHQARMLEVFGSSTGQSRRLADEVRGTLREVGETTSREARRLQLELERVGEVIAVKTAPAGRTGEPATRRHEVKP